MALAVLLFIGVLVSCSMETTAQAVEFDLNAGHTCNTGFLPLISNWQDCKQAAESLGFNGDNVAHVDYNGGWGTSRPQGCFQSDGSGRIHFNEGSGGNSVGTDKILCKADTCVDLDNGDLDPYGNTACNDGFPVAPEFPYSCDNDAYDTEDFDAKTMCCLCGGGGVCVDIDNGALDSDGNSCTNTPGPGPSCGIRDDDDFVADTLCCKCRGGGKYWVTEINTNCPAHQVITTKSECEVVSAPFSFAFVGVTQLVESPAGCNTFEAQSWFNDILDPESTTPMNNRSAVCSQAHCSVNGEAGDGSTQGDCGANQVCKANGICADTAPCCTSWDAACHTVSNENSNNHACDQCGGDPCYADCSSDAASDACKDCCIAAVHYKPWNCPACPCQNGGYCTGADLDNDGQEDCDCTAAAGFEGAHCEVNTARKELEEQLEKCNRKSSEACAMVDCSQPKAGLLCPGKCRSCKNYKGRDWCLEKKRAGECDHEWVNLRCRATCAKCCGNVYSESTCAKLTYGVTGSRRCRFSTKTRNNCRRSCGLCGKKADSE